MSNYIPDVNKFKLAGPPDWWLRLLKDFDPSLYVVPSRQGFYYRLAQKRPLNLSAKFVNDMLFQQSDTHMLAQYSLVPVTTIVATATWSPLMFAELAKRAVWMQGGAEKFEKRLLEKEAEASARVDAEIDQNLDDRNKMAWKLYQAKTGQRTFVNSKKVKMAPDLPGYRHTSSGLLVPTISL